jgi:ABC-type glycerol-3-phosphate transport system permease component
MQQLLTLVSENKVLSALWGVFTAAFFFVVQQWYTGDEQVAAIRLLSAEVEEQSGEYSRANRVFELRNETFRWLDQKSREMSDSVDAAALAPENLDATVARMIDTFKEMYEKLETARAVVAGVYFETHALQELQGGLVRDLDQNMAYLQARLEFMKAIQMDFDKARQLADSIRDNADARRNLVEVNARTPTYEYIIEKARTEHNNTVARANAQLRMYHLRSKLTVVASTYMGLFIGGFGGYLLSRYRRRQRQEASANSKGATLTDDVDRSG